MGLWGGDPQDTRWTCPQAGARSGFQESLAVDPSLEGENAVQRARCLEVCRKGGEWRAG